jgi:hypothetical protein
VHVRQVLYHWLTSLALTSLSTFLVWDLSSIPNPRILIFKKN